MLRIAAAVAAVAVGATVVAAQNLDAIKQRREAMKTIANASVQTWKMSKGELPFDLPKVQSVLKTFQDEGAKLKPLFPDDSKKGGETDAQPKIWENKSAFNAEVDKFVETAKNAATHIKDEVSFKAEYPKVAQACGGCHKETDGFTLRLGDSFKKLKQ